MKKTISLFLAALCILAASCNVVNVFDKTDPTTVLNYYNSYWDNFSGSLEEGKVYTYSNKKYNSKLRFTAFQCITKNRVLFQREDESGQINGEYQDICDEAMFLIISNRTYADGATLHDGNYKCLGTYTYETKGGFNKTVYMLQEIQPGNP